MRYIIIYCFLSLSMLVGCEDDNSNKVALTDKSSDKKEYIMETTTDNDQTLRVISAYEYVEEYVKKAEATEERSEENKLWNNIVLTNIQENCLSGEHAHLVEEYVNTPPRDLKKVKDDITMLHASEPEEVALEALEKSANALPGEDTTVCLLPSGNLDYGGVNVGAGKVSVFYFPDFNKDRLKQTVAHEYHHSTWTEKFSQNYEWDLLGNIIFERKAEYFASLLYEEPVVKSYHLNKGQEKEVWDQVKDSLHTTKQERVDEVLYGDGGEIPYSFGYIAGYHIVRAYADKHPQATIEEWTKLSPEILYKSSGYEEK